MKKALSFIVAVILLISATAFGVSAEDGVPTDEEIAQAQALFDSTENAIPGQVIVYIKNDNVTDNFDEIVLDTLAKAFPDADEDELAAMAGERHYQIYQIKVDASQTARVYAFFKKAGETYGFDVYYNVLIKLEIMMYGDLDGDLQITIRDYAMLKRWLLGTYELSNIQIVLGDVNQDNNSDLTDYAMMKRHVLGTYTIPRITIE